MIVHRLQAVCLPVLLAVSLSGCGILKERMESNIDDAFENVVSDLSALSLDNLSQDSSDAREEVGKLAAHKGGNARKTEEAIKTALQKADLAALDKAFLTYQLARCQMFDARPKEADATFREALTLAEALDPKQPNLLEAEYYGYSVCLKRQGRTAESQSYKAKYQALSAEEAKKRKAKAEPEDAGATSDR